MMDLNNEYYQYNENEVVEEVCNHTMSPLYIKSVEILPLGYVEYTVKCLDCDEELEIIKTARKGGEFGLVGKTVDKFPYMVPCDYDYETVKEAYNMMLSECEDKKYVYGPCYLAYLLRRSYGSELDRN